MLKEICFATNNAHKLAEVQSLMQGKCRIVSLKEIGCTEDIPETADTIEGNSLLKAQYVLQTYGIACFADDSGLEADALQGAPGVYSARFAGPQKNDADNMRLLLQKMQGVSQRDAQFKTVITFCTLQLQKSFEGIIRGTIALEPAGNNGFGYDPVFIPVGYTQRFAEMEASQKNAISHRAIATKKFLDFLLTYNEG